MEPNHFGHGTFLCKEVLASFWNHCKEFRLQAVHGRAAGDVVHSFQWTHFRVSVYLYRIRF